MGMNVTEDLLIVIAQFLYPLLDLYRLGIIIITRNMV